MSRNGNGNGPGRPFPPGNGNGFENNQVFVLVLKDQNDSANRKISASYVNFVHNLSPLTHISIQNGGLEFSISKISLEMVTISISISSCWKWFWKWKWKWSEIPIISISEHLRY